MKGFKAFGKGMICRGKQYAENTVFEEKEAAICWSGMHFCENPLDVLDYYPLVDENGDIVEVAKVEALDECQTDDNKKYCTKKLKIGVKLSLKAFVKAAIDFAFEKIDNKVSTGDDVQMASSGDDVQMASSGDGVKMVSSGDGVKMVSSGDGVKMVSSGYGVKMVSSGYGVQMASSGYGVQMASSGYDVQMASSGDGVQMASSGDGVQMVSSGDGVKMVSSGDGVKMVSSGYDVQMASSGYDVQMASSGDGVQMVSSGDGSVIAGIGKWNTAKGKKGSWLVLAEWGYNDIERKYIPTCVKAAQIDGVVIKEDTFYKLENGEFKEA